MLSSPFGPSIFVASLCFGLVELLLEETQLMIPMVLSRKMDLIPPRSIVFCARVNAARMLYDYQFV